MASWLSQVRALIAAAALPSWGCGGPPAPSPAAGEPPAPVTRMVPEAAAAWNAGTVYFLVTDRFADGDSANDRALGRAHDGALLRNFEGGDFAGVRQKIETGWFDSLGVTAIWMTPFVEQVHGSTDEGTGKTYGYHGYWARDWTAVDPAFGTKAELHALVDAAHRHGIRVLMDAVINHTGPVTPVDPAWPAEWVRTQPTCTYRDYATATTCTLVANLPDVRTESDDRVALPAFLAQKWMAEGRLEAEQASLDAFFRRTGYPRAPRYYFIKWLTDWVREFGFDGYRLDTAKHFGESVSAEIKREAVVAYADWRRAHPREVRDSLPFVMLGEVYGWAPDQGRAYDFGDRKVDYFSYGYDALINFAFKAEARGALDGLYLRYGATLHGGPLNGLGLLNYVDSHDDGGPYDPDRKDPLGAGTRLLLAPGAAQIYYGDELARPLRIPGAQGDANLRSLMNWGDLAGGETGAVLAHWRRLGRFRKAHPAVGAGEHRSLQASPFVFARSLDLGRIHDRVVVALDQPAGAKTIPVGDAFPEGAELVDSYSGATGRVIGGAVTLTSDFTLVLLARRN